MKIYELPVLAGSGRAMEEVVITGRGQITIPLGLRAKYRLRNGSNLEILDTVDGILLRPKVSTYETSGSTSREASAAEIEELLEKTLAQES